MDKKLRSRCCCSPVRTSTQGTRKETHRCIGRRVTRARSLHCCIRPPGSSATPWERESIVAILLGAGAKFDAKDAHGRTPVYWAASRGHHTVVEALLEAGADGSVRAMNGTTPLHAAAMRNTSRVMRVLLATDVEADARDENGDTPLHAAASRGLISGVQVLLGAGTEVESKDDDGNTPLSLAVQHERDVVAEILRDHGARD